MTGSTPRPDRPGLLEYLWGLALAVIAGFVGGSTLGAIFSV
jgi:hypothetical protein